MHAAHQRVRIKRRILASLVVVVVAAIVAMTAVVSAAPAQRSADNEATTMRVARDVVWSTIDDDDLTLDVYAPDSDSGASRAAVVLIHGGGWQGGEKEDFVAEANRLAARGYVAVSIDYRLAPEDPFPDAAADVLSVVAWLRESAQVERWSIDPTRIGVLGASAGGNLASMVGTVGEGALDEGSRVAVVVSWSGVYDFLGDVDGSGYFGCTAKECPETAAAASPLTYLDPTDAPTLLVQSVGDGIVPLSQAQTMASALADAGVAHRVLKLPGTGHAQQLSGAAWADTVAFLDRYLA
jgi:acetyl esterase/lipase